MNTKRILAVTKNEVITTTIQPERISIELSREEATAIHRVLDHAANDSSPEFAANFNHASYSQIKETTTRLYRLLTNECGIRGPFFAPITKGN